MIPDGFWMLWVYSKEKTIEKAVAHFENKYGYKPTQYSPHPQDHPLLSIRSRTFRKNIRGPLPMKGQVYIR